VCIFINCITVSFTLSRLSFYRQLLEQLSVALLSRPTVFVPVLLMLLLYCVQINDDDDDDYGG